MRSVVRWIFGVVGILLVTSVAAAQDTASPPQSPQQGIIDQLIEAGLTTPINETQTSGEASVTLDWVYADPLRIALQYTIRNVDPTTAMMSFNRTNQLSDPQGIQFGYQSAYFDDVVDQETVARLTYYTNAYDPNGGMIEDYFLDDVGVARENVELNLNVRIGGYTLEEWDTYALPAESTLQAGDEVPLIGDFNFSFNTPVQPQIQLDLNQTITNADLDVTLDSVTVTPSTIAADMCAELPDASSWMPSASVQVDNQLAFAAGWGLQGMPSETDTTRCFNMTFDAMVDLESPELTLSIVNFERSMSEDGSDWQAIQPIMAEMGYDFDVIIEQGENGGGLRLEPSTVYQAPGFQEAVRDARIQVGQIFEGSWIFQIAGG